MGLFCGPRRLHTDLLSPLMEATHDGATHDGATHDGPSHDEATHDGATHDGATPIEAMGLCLIDVQTLPATPADTEGAREGNHGYRGCSA